MRVYKRAKNIGASHRKRPLLEVKQTSRFDGAMSAYDPKRTWDRSPRAVRASSAQKARIALRGYIVAH